MEEELTDQIKVDRYPILIRVLKICVPDLSFANLSALTKEQLQDIIHVKKWID